MNLRLFLDANILFTAAYSPEGLSALLFELGARRLVTLLTSENAVQEARINLQLKRPAALLEFDRLSKLIEVVDTPAAAPIVLDLPEDDLALFSAGLACRATHFITGDRQDFGRYFNRPNQTGGIVIQSVRPFFEARF